MTIRHKYHRGDLLRQTLLGTTAVYKVSGLRLAGYELEIVKVPGLSPGMHIRVTRDAAERMTLLDREEARAIIYATEKSAA